MTYPDLLDDGFSAFSPAAIQAILKILEKYSDVRILLTTSHKGNYDRQEWIQIFRNRGIVVQALDKLDDNTGNLDRKGEILNWLSNNEITPGEKILIIDDDKSLFGLPPHLKTSLVITSPMIGLTEELIP